MATLTLKNLTKLQSNKIAMMFEDDNDFLDYINDEFENLDLPKIEVNGIEYDDGDNEIKFSELHEDEDEDEDE